MRRRISLGICFVLSCIPAEQARAQFLPLGIPAQEPTQILNHAQLALSYLKEAQMVISLTIMATNMVREASNLVNHPSSNAMADMAQLSTILSQSQGLAVGLAQLDTNFRTIYAPYSSSPAVTYASAYNKWANSTLNAIHGSLASAGMQSDMIISEQGFMQQVQTMNQTAMGRDQLVQVGNTIASEEVSQLQKLRQLMISDMESKAAYTAQQANIQQQTSNAQQNAFANANFTSDRRGW